jgi:hypothetical protein
MWTVKRYTINGSDEMLTKGGWASARDINKWTRRMPGAQNPDFISLGERVDQEYDGA